MPDLIALLAVAVSVAASATLVVSIVTWIRESRFTVPADLSKRLTFELHRQIWAIGSFSRREIEDGDPHLVDAASKRLDIVLMQGLSVAATLQELLDSPEDMTVARARVALKPVEALVDDMAMLSDDLFAAASVTGSPPSESTTASLVESLESKAEEFSRAVSEIERAELDSAKSVWSRWGATFAATMMSSLLILGVTIYVSRDQPDCASYTRILLAISEQASTTEAAIKAASAVDWDLTETACGSSASFLSNLAGRSDL